MSLHAVANHLASKGRGDDQVLVHMTRPELAGLQALAQKHYGRGLTTNPETGLPEAGILAAILPAIAGIGLAMTGVGAPMAALMVGGGMTLATGSLQKGLMAGLGAFGGAGMGEALAGMGTAAAAAAPSAAAQTIGASAVPAAETASSFGDMGIDAAGAASDAGNGLALSGNTLNGAGMASDAGNGLSFADTGAAQAANYTPFEQGFPDPGTVSPTAASANGFDKFKDGIGSLGQPGGFDKFIAAQGGGMKALTNAGLAFGPALTSAFSPKKPTPPQDDAMIRPYSYDPTTQRYTAQTPYMARDANTRFGFADGGAVIPYTYDPKTQQFSTQSPPQLNGATSQTRPYSYDPRTQQFTALAPPVQPQVTVSPALMNPMYDSGGGGGDGGGGYSGGGIAALTGGGNDPRFMQGPGDGVSDSIPAAVQSPQGVKPAKLADGEFVVPARIVSEIGNGSSQAGARKLYAMMDRVQSARAKTVGRGRVAVPSGADQALPA